MLTKYYDSMIKTPNLFDTLSIFDDLYGPGWSRPSDVIDSSCRVNPTDEGLELSFDLPGVKKADLSVQVTGNQVDISGKVRDRDFKRSYRISRTYDPDPVEAILEDGVLTLKFLRSPETRPRRIEIR